MPNDLAAEMVMKNGVDPMQFHRVEQELADAVEQVTAAEGVIEALSRAPVVPIRAAQTAPQDTQPKPMEAKR